MMDTEDGQFFIKNLAHFVRTHEKALANALQLRRQQSSKHGSSHSTSGAIGASAMSPTTPTNQSASAQSTSSTLAAALSLPYLTFTSHNIKPAKLALTSHHLFYLLSRFEELGIQVGPMNVRLENLHADTSAANYVSFLSQSRRPKAHTSDNGSIHSVSSVRSAMSGMSSLWSSFGLGPKDPAARTEKQKAAIDADLKYLYSAFTKIPCLRLTPDRRARLIEGFEEFPFDTAVPLIAFKNISALEISDIDIRQFYGWDRLADQLRSLSVKRAGVDDPEDLLINIVLDDMDKRRRRSSKPQISPSATWPTSGSPNKSPSLRHAELVKSGSAPGSPEQRSQDEDDEDARTASLMRGSSNGSTHKSGRPRSSSPMRSNSRGTSAQAALRSSHKVKRSGSGSSTSSLSDGWHRNSSSNLLALGILPPSKWRFLRHLSLADNALTAIAANSLAPLADTLHSLDLSSNLFSQIPDCLASLTALRALNLSNCMIDSLHSLTRNPLPAITALNLRQNRLISIAGIERLYSLERLDLRDNRLTDPTELARLTGLPEIREIWISGNPFVKTHSGYRVTIFNLFRKTPGYTEDIMIDGYSPGYTERRQLVERVAEKPNVPVIKRPVPGQAPSNTEASKPVVEYPRIKEPIMSRKERPIPAATMSEVNTTSSGRRRKTPKRRIVDLSTADTSPQKPTVRFSTDAVPSDGIKAPQSVKRISPEASPRTTPAKPALEPRHTQFQSEIPRMDTSVVPQLPPLETIKFEPQLIKPPSKDGPDWNISGELYRKKIEALRNDVGNGWLSVLSEESWEAQKKPQAPIFGSDFPPTVMRPAIAPSAGSQQAVSSGRTLG